MSESKNAYLVVEKGTPYSRREVFVVAEKRFTIGRATEYHHPDLPFTNRYISREHAEIERRDDSYFLREHSKHGTQVNGVRIDKTEPYRLQEGDQIGLAGNEASITFSLTPPPEVTDDLPPLHKINIVLDEGKREVWIEGKLIPLTGNRYTLFRLLYQRRGEVVSKLTIMQEVWPERQSDHDRPMVGDVEVAELVKWLRIKLGEYESLVSNKRGFGYMLK